MKWSSFRYLTKQGLHNLRANRLMSLASIGVLTACLLLTGIAGLFSANVNSLVEYLGDQNETVVYLDQGLSDEIGELIGLLDAGKIPFHRVHENIGDAADKLPVRDREGKLRIHECESRTVEGTVQPYFLMGIFIGENGRITGFTARRRQRQDGADRHGLREAGAPDPEIPYIGAGVRRAVSDRLGRIDHAASADGQNEIGMEA